MSGKLGLNRILRKHCFTNKKYPCINSWHWCQNIDIILEFDQQLTVCVVILLPNNCMYHRITCVYLINYWQCVWVLLPNNCMYHMVTCVYIKNKGRLSHFKIHLSGKLGLNRILRKHCFTNKKYPCINSWHWCQNIDIILEFWSTTDSVCGYTVAQHWLLLCTYHMVTCVYITK